MATLAELRAGAKPDTLTVPRTLAEVRASRPPNRPYTGTPDLPLEDQGIGPLEMATFGAPAGAAMRGAGGAALPWFYRVARQGAAAGAGYEAARSAAHLGEPGNAPLSNTLTGAAAGALASPLIEGAMGGVSRLLPRRSAPASVLPAPAEPPAASIATPEQRAPVGLGEPAPKRLVPRQPLAPTSRANQFPALADIQAEIEKSPDYLARIDALGGGRRVSHPETVARALHEGGPMHPDQIAAWEASTPVSEVTVMRAGMTKDWYQQRFLNALTAGDDAAARAAAQELDRIAPGFNNITATPGRATEVQKMFVQDEVTKATLDMMDLANKGVPFNQVREAADQKLRELSRSEAVRRGGAEARKWMGALETYATRAKLTSPMTHVFNTVSNAITFMVNRPLEKVATAGARLAQGDVKGARADVRYLFGTTQGLVDGMRRFAAEFGPEARGMGKAAEFGDVKPPGRLRFVDPFRWLSAQDAFWKGVLKDAELKTLAYESATKQGLKGDALARRLTELMDNPPAPWIEKAEAHAKEFTFQSDPGQAINAIATMVSKVPGGRLIVPFIRTPFDIARFQMQRSPLGLMSRQNLTDLASGGPAQAQAAGRLLSGTALALSGWAAATRGEITGAWPVDAREREAWTATGRQAYSIKVGNRWVAYNRFQPLGAYLAQSVALRDALEAGDKNGAGALYTQLVLQGGRAVLDQPFLTGLSAAFDAISDPVKEGPRLVQSMVTGMIPNISRDVRQQTDVVQRNAKGVGPGVMNMLPGASQNLEPRTTAVGDTVKYEPNRLLRATKIVSPARETPESRAMLEAATAPKAEKNPLSRPDLGLKGKDLTRFNLDLAAAEREAVRQTIGGAEYKAADSAERRNILGRARQRAHSEVRKRWKSDITANAGKGTR